VSARPRANVVFSLIGLFAAAFAGAMQSAKKAAAGSPRSHVNGGSRSGAAAAKRAARKLRNVRKHPRCQAGGRRA
jgi:hypothetical protein